MQPKRYLRYILVGLCGGTLALWSHASSAPSSAAVNPANLSTLMWFLLFLFGMSGYLYWCARRGWVWLRFERVQRDKNPIKFTIIMASMVLFLVFVGSATIYNVLRLCRAGACDVSGAMSNGQFLVPFAAFATVFLCIAIQDIRAARNER